MLDSRILTILKQKVLYMGTACENIPKVRPMRPFVDSMGNIWLITHKDTQKSKEIERNNIVELCTLSDEHDVLRLQGRLLLEKNLDLGETTKVRRDIMLSLSGIGDFFVDAADSNMMIYKLIVDNVIFRSVAAADKSELNFKP
jgi:uncharacterized pyridoxamine 5'-phosphate oxidase family protein